MPGPVTTFDPAKHAFSFLGNTFTAFGKDSFIKASRDEDAFTKEVGTTGEVVRSKNNNRCGSVEVTVMAHSQDNDILSSLAAADELTGTTVGELTMLELNGTSRLSASQAWIRKAPDMERAKVAGEVVWIFDCADLEIFHGGLVL